MKHILRTILVVGSLTLLAACDPGEIARQKVPDPLKSWLTFGPKAKDGAPAVASLEIVQPKPGSIMPATASVTFQAAADPGHVKPGTVVDVQWTVLPLDGKPQQPIGKGNQVQKKLEPGSYRAEAVMVVGQQRLVKDVSFRVAINVAGRVQPPPGGSAAGTKIVVTEAESGQHFSETEVKADGAFLAEVPGDGYVMVTPRKAGCTFVPLYRTVTFGSDDKLDFSTVSGEITGLRLSDRGHPDAAIQEACPSQEAQLTMEVKSQAQPIRFEASLVARKKHEETLIPFDDVSALAGEDAATAGQTKVLAVKLPSLTHLRESTGTYRLRVTVTDDKGASMTADVPNLIKIDVDRCFHRGLTASVGLLEAGKFAEATKVCSTLDEYTREVEDPSRYGAVHAKVLFNRGLAQLGSALEIPLEDPKRVSFLRKAVVDFNTVVKLDDRDVEAFLFRGLANHLVGLPDGALKDYAVVVHAEPKSVVPRVLRAHALVKSGTKRNLATAVDDLTEAITLDPSNTGLRKTRSSLFGALMKAGQEGDDSRVDTAGIPLPEVDKQVNLVNHVRK